MPWVAATYRAAVASSGVAACALPWGLGPQGLSQALVLLREVLHLALQADLGQLELIDVTAQILQLHAEPPLGGALLPKPARHLFPLALPALRPRLQSAQLRGLAGVTPGAGRAESAGAAWGRDIQLGQQEASRATQAPHVPLQTLHLLPQAVLLLAHQAQLEPLGPPAALQSRRLPPQRLVLAPQPLPQPPQPPSLLPSCTLLFQNLQVGGG